MVRRRLLLAVGGLVLVVLLGVAAVAIGFTEPSLVSVDNRWGTISADTSEIQSEIVVANPNPFGIPPILDIRYEVRLNQVPVAEGHKQGVGLSTGTNSVRLTTEMDNSKIAEWWVTHVANSERSTVTIDPRVSIRWTPIDIDLPNQREAVRTDVLEPINADPDDSVRLLHDPHLLIEHQEAHWGEPADGRTPIEVSTTLENRFSTAATIADFTYRITLNDVAVADDRIDTVHRIPPHSTETIELRLYIQNSKLNEWWVSHVRNGETTLVTIEIRGTVGAEGVTERVPIQFPDQTTTVETEILGAGTGR